MGLIHTANPDGLNSTPVSAAAPLPVTVGTRYPAGATALSASAVTANVEANPTFPAVAGKTNYISGLSITGGGATAAALITANLQGIINNGIANASWILAVPAGVTLGIEPIVVTFDPPLPATAANLLVGLTVPAFGAGNTKVAAAIWGFVV